MKELENVTMRPKILRNLRLELNAIVKRYNTRDEIMSGEIIDALLFSQLPHRQ